MNQEDSARFLASLHEKIEMCTVESLSGLCKAGVVQEHLSCLLLAMFSSHMQGSLSSPLRPWWTLYCLIHCGEAL